MTDTKATRPPTQRELTEAEKNYAVLAITQPDGIYVSDRTLGSVLGELRCRRATSTKRSAEGAMIQAKRALGDET